MNLTVLIRYPQIFKKKLKIAKKKAKAASFPLRFINDVVVQFNKNTYNNNETNGEDKMIIPPQLFEIPNKIYFYKYHFVE